MDDFLFVVGSARSGTTMLRSMLDSHPDLAIPGETHFIRPMAVVRRRYERASGFATDRFLHDIMANGNFEFCGFPLDTVKAQFSASPPASFADAMRSVFRAYADQHGKSRYGDKTPGNASAVGLLARVFPDARFVHIVRDGRNIAASLLSIKEWGPSTTGEAALYWRSQVLAASRAGRQLPPNRYLEISYEELVDDPEQVLGTLCEFASLPFDAQMLRYTERAEGLADTNLYPAYHQNLFKAPTRGLRDWQSEMSERDVAIFEALAGDVLQQHGYALGSTAAIRRRLRMRAEVTRLSKVWHWSAGIPTRVSGFRRNYLSRAA